MKIKTVFKIILALAVIFPGVAGIVYYTMNTENIPFENICDKSNDKYTNLCDNIGKHAHTAKNLQLLNDNDFGEIIGVSWRKRGSMINIPGQEHRVSDSNSYYYIIKSEQKGYYFLRIANETDPR